MDKLKKSLLALLIVVITVGAEELVRFISGLNL